MSIALERTKDEVMMQIDAALEEKGLDYPAAWAFMFLVDNENKISGALSRAGRHELASELHKLVTWIEYGKEAYEEFERVSNREVE